MSVHSLRRTMMMRRAFSSKVNAGFPIQISSEVSSALSEGKPVVALESTIVAHGMPWPQNYEAALSVEACIREQGAIPATIAVLKGKPVVGLSNNELEYLAQAGPKVMKCSTRELPLVMASNQDGATTVAATARLAHLCGIHVFVTGGIGGVHRNGEITWDVSADLVELRSNPIIVVCAGVKSILDIGRTLEYLETMGIPVISYGTNEFPAFFTPYSNFKSPARLNTPQEVASHFLAARSLNLSAGTLLAIPNPHPTAGAEVEEAIQSKMYILFIEVLLVLVLVLL